MRRLTTLATTLVATVAMGLPAGATPRTSLQGASTTAAATIGATEVRADHTGEGIGIALVDTGVSPRPGLNERVAARIDVSGAGRLTDGHGHGTFLAGLMVGQDGPDGDLGVAPGAHLLSVKVADADGATSLDRVLAGLGAVRAARDQLNIRVVVLALGGPHDDIPDPLEEALEQLWSEGFVVVVAAGNENVLVEPGVSPYLLTVGAIDDRGTPAHDDDTVASWSATGSGRAGAAKPDVLAPGTSLVSTRVPGSSADRENPRSRIAGQWFRGSGTSMAAAVTAGAAAVLLEARPELTPDQVKGRLVSTARAIEGSSAGVVDLPAAIALDGEVDGNRGLPPLEFTAPEAPGSYDPNGVVWSGVIWKGVVWSGVVWSGVVWSGVVWSGVVWSDADWEGRSWIGRSWVDMNWDGRSWIGHSWIDQAWEGRSWVDRSWISADWTAGAWLDADWS